MGDDDGKAMIQNTPQADAAGAGAITQPSKEEKKPPAGCVERVLNFRDRNILIGACRQFCDKDGKGDHKAASRLDRVTKILCLQETIDYFAMIDDSLEDALFKWQRDRNNYLSQRQYEAGGLTIEELRKRAPSVDPSTQTPKPKKVQPEATPAEMRGPERPFYIPSVLDAWIQGVLKVAVFSAVSAEYVTELCVKFGIKEDD